MTNSVGCALADEPATVNMGKQLAKLMEQGVAIIYMET